MAARKKIRHDENTRNRIHASSLVNLMYNHALGKTEMSATRLRACESLLRKVLPDLSDVRVEVDSQPITFQLDLGGKK